MTDIPSITCPVCTRTSYNPNDIRNGYCSSCHAYTSTLGETMRPQDRTPPSSRGMTATEHRQEAERILYREGEWIGTGNDTVRALIALAHALLSLDTGERHV